MAYGTSNRTRSNTPVYQDNRNLRLDDKLDSHHKPVKIGDDQTGLQLADKDVSIEGNLNINGTAKIGGDVTFQGSNISTIAGDLQSGMVIGYTRISNDSTTSNYGVITVDSSAMTVLATVQLTPFSVTFKAPPSGSVEIQCSFWLQSISDGAKFSLSDEVSYNELDEKHTYDADQTIFYDETDHNMHTIKFAVTGLTAGTSHTYYLAGLASGAGVYIKHGRNRSGGTHFPPIILKAIALPTITTGE